MALHSQLEGKPPSFPFLFYLLLYVCLFEYGHSITFKVSMELIDECCYVQTHSGSVWRVTWAHPEFGQVLASCSFDRTAAVWEEIVGESNDKQRGLSHWVSTLALHFPFNITVC